MVTNKNVLVVDDDPTFRQLISTHLASLGAFVSGCETNDEFIKRYQQINPDVILLDKEIGEDNGFDLIDVVRKHPSLSNIPIIIVSGAADEYTRHEAVTIGADDVLSKPLSFRELETRLIANLRRSKSYTDQENIYCMGGIKINFTRHHLTIDENPVELTRTEYKILTELILKSEQIVNRDYIASKFLSLKNSNARTIDVHINSLRKKLGQYSGCLKTIRGRGYMFHMDI